MRVYAEACGIELMVEVARYNQVEQNSQVTKLLTNDPAVLILCPQDSARAAALEQVLIDSGYLTKAEVFCGQ